MGNSPSEACFSTAGEEFYNHTDTGMNSTEFIHPEQVVLDNQKFATIHYPSRDHPECVEICYSDTACLNPGSYLMSTIMNFYIQYLQIASSSTGSSRGEYHFFNTYFYNKLEEAASDMSDKNACFAKFRRWLRGVNIFQKTLFLPIHRNLHWSLVIVCMPAMEERSGPVILHLDSLGLHDTTLIFGNIERYLKEERKHIGRNSSPSFPISERTWRKLPESIVKKKIQVVPQQKNEYDCSLFVLYFIERFVEDAPERIKLKDLDKFGNTWFDSEEASRLRTKSTRVACEGTRSADASLEEDGGSATSSNSFEEYSIQQSRVFTGSTQRG